MLGSYGSDATGDRTLAAGPARAVVAEYAAGEESVPASDGGEPEALVIAADETGAPGQPPPGHTVGSEGVALVRVGPVPRLLYRWV
jgi:hypothetical protein